MMYPLYTVRVEVVLQMTRIDAHEGLKAGLGLCQMSPKASLFCMVLVLKPHKISCIIFTEPTEQECLGLGRYGMQGTTQEMGKLRIDLAVSDNFFGSFFRVSL